MFARSVAGLCGAVKVGVAANGPCRLDRNRASRPDRTLRTRRTQHGLGRDVDRPEHDLLPADQLDEFKRNVGVDALERDDVDRRLLQERGGLLVLLPLRSERLLPLEVRASMEGATKERIYDGLVKKPDGTWEGIEVKSGTSADKAQKAFDQAVSYDHPAYAKLNGESIEITSVNYQRVK